MTTVTEHPNVQRLREQLDIWNAGDPQKLRQFFAEDTVVHFAGKNALSGTYRGWEQMLTLLGKALELTGGTLKGEVLDVMADDTHGLVLYRATAERGGRRLDVTLANVFKADASGRWNQVWYLPDDQRQYDDFFSSSLQRGGQP